MRQLWNIVSILAVANLMALVAFGGWLAATGRVNGERVEKVRRMFSHTVAQETALTEEAAKAKDEGGGAVINVADPGGAAGLAQPGAPGDGGGAAEGGGRSAADVLTQQHDLAEIEFQHLQRLRREVEDMRQSFTDQLNDLKVRETAIAERERRFQETRERIKQMEGDAQFRVAVGTLEAQRPADAMTMLDALLELGQETEVVSYLNAMDERARGKVIAEFAKQDGSKASRLLEKLRTRGLADPGAEAAPS